MHKTELWIEGALEPFAGALAALLHDGHLACSTLVNADAEPACAAITARCRSFAAQRGGDESLIVTLLRAPAAGLAHEAAHETVAGLWAFIRLAALEWAPRGIRVNAIGLGTGPAGPFEPQEQAGRAAFPAQAAAATAEDVARTILAMAAWPSMTGQIIRLGV